MRINTLMIIIFFSLLTVWNQKTFSKQSKKIKITNTVKKSFKSKSSFYLYRSFLTGQKRGVSKDFKLKLQRLSLLHLLTPSGLHLTSLLLFFAFFKRKKKSKLIDYFEIGLFMTTYLFLPGYFSLRRVCLLRSLFILNKIFALKLSKTHLFVIFLIVDIFFGTFKENSLSFLLSILFLGFIFVPKRVNFIKVSILFFIGQCLIAYVFGSKVSILSLFFSPITTTLFTFLFPLMILNIVFIQFINYSEIIVNIFQIFIEFQYYIVTHFDFLNLNFLFILGILIINKKTLFLSLSILLLSQYAS